MPSKSRLTNLPAPTILLPLDYETILAERIASAQTKFNAAGIAYDVGNMETDPVVIVLQDSAARELNLRAQFNDAAVRANLYAFADGADLDQHGAFYDVARLEGEDDDRYFQRIQLGIAGRSTGGSEAQYKLIAMSASLLVEEVEVYRVDGGPELFVAITSTDNGGVPSQGLIDIVQAAIDAEAVLSDIITVGSAISETVNITADVWLLPDTPEAVFDALPDTLAGSWDDECSVGFDLNRSWIKARLMIAGVSDVEVTAPAQNVTADNRHRIALGTVTLTLKGRKR